MTFSVQRVGARALAILLSALATLGAVPAEQSFADEVPGPAITIASLDPEEYRLGDDLYLQVETAGLPAEGRWFVETFLRPTQFVSAAGMDAFLAGEDFPGWRIDARYLDISGSGAAEWVVPADQMPWPDEQTTGGRGLVVRFSNGAEVHEARSLLVYYPLEQLPTTAINVTLTALAEGGLGSSSLFAEPGLTWALPRATLVQKSSGQDPRLTLLGRQLDERGAEILARPQAEADLSALASGGLESLLEVAAPTRAMVDSRGTPLFKNAAPIDDAVLVSDIGFTGEGIAQLEGNLLIAPRTWSFGQFTDAGTTPTSPVELSLSTEEEGAEGDRTVTLIDHWERGEDILNLPFGTPAEELAIRQKLRTLTMLVGLEDPSDKRYLFLTFEQEAALDDPAFEGRIAAVLGNDWVEPVSLRTLAASPTSQIARPEIPESSDGLNEYSSALRPLDREYDRAILMASVTDPGEQLLAPFRAEVLAPTSSDITTERRATFVDKAMDSLGDLTGAITIAPVGTVNVVHQETKFPVSVSNSGIALATVDIALIPSDPRLQSPERVRAKIPAGGQVEVMVPITAVGAGDITVAVEAQTDAGEVLARSAAIPVRVRPNWEDIGIIGLGGTVVIVFLLGLIRSVARGKRRSQGGPGRGGVPRHTAGGPLPGNLGGES